VLLNAAARRGLMFLELFCALDEILHRRPRTDKTARLGEHLKCESHSELSDASIYGRARDHTECR
jgi:hypothetical protein